MLLSKICIGTPSISYTKWIPMNFGKAFSHSENQAPNVFWIVPFAGRITSLISAVSFREIADATPWLISLANNPSEDIRWRVAWALPIRGIENPPIYQTSIETLVKLMQDPEPRVREWATFSLSMTDEDTPAIRHALLERLSDSDFQTRSEAAIGLANRKEQAGIDLLVEHLQSDRVGELYVQAAEIYADCRLRPALLALAKWLDVDPELLDKALVACS